MLADECPSQSELEFLIEQRLSKEIDIILGNMCIKCLFLKKFNFLLNVHHSVNGELPP